MTKALTYVELEIPTFIPSHSLLHFDGTDTSTVFTDDGNVSAHTWTNFGSGAQIDTAQFKFGGASGLFNGASFIIPEAGTGEQIQFEDNDFTIDFWVRFASLAGLQVIYDMRPLFINGLYPTICMNGSVIRYFTDFSDRIVGGTTLVINIWYHVALTRSGSETKLFLNGVQEGSTYTDENIYLCGTDRPVIGCDFNGASFFNGWVDECRIVSNFAAWDETFTPSTTAYDEMTTYRFAIDTGYLPNSIDCIPSIKNVAVTPATVSLGESLGQRASITITLRDHKHIFDGEDFSSGTFWGKFRARYGLKLRGENLRLIRGELGEEIGDMETRHFLVESTDGPSTNGEFKIIAKDILKLADGDRAQAPVLSNGFLASDITATDTLLTLSPTGIGDEEYPLSGHLNLGGSEVVQFRRAYSNATVTGNDKVLLLMNQGPDASTTFIDSALAHSFSATGNAQLDAVTDSPYGGFAGLFDGSGDWVVTADSADFVLGTSDFAIDCWFKRSTTGQHFIAGQCDSSALASTVSFVMGINGANQVTASVGIGGVATTANGTTAVTDTTNWHHILFNRSGSTFRLFLDGDQEATFSNAGSIQNSVNTLRVGAAGELTTATWQGWLQQFRFTVGAARHTANFAEEDDYALTLTSSGNVVFIERFQYNTEAAEHSAQDRAQVCLEYVAEDVADIIYDLMTTYAGVDPDFITLASWQTETASYLNTVYSALVAEPKAVGSLISELIEQAGIIVWWDDLNQQVRLQVIRGIPTTAFTFDEDNVMAETLEVKEQPDKRLSQVYFYFAKFNPLINEDQINNYGSTALIKDADAEAEYGSAVIKKIFSRWVTSGGRTTAETAAENILSRFRDPPRLMSFDVFRGSVDTPTLGGGYQLEGWPFQTTTGEPDQIPIQLTRVAAEADRYKIEAEEMLFVASAPFSPDNRQIVIDFDQNNVNLRDMHDSLYSTAGSGDTVTCTITDGTTVGAFDTSQPAFNVGTWAAGVTINLIVEGRIQGKGGAGGAGAQIAFGSGSAGAVGSVGGTALYTRYAINLTSTNGEIWGGGGGGGGGGASTDGSSFAVGGSGGGGGAGTSGGAGGGAGFGSTSPGLQAGSAGSDSAGGAGGAGGGFNGGAGGGPGASGSTGQSGSNIAGRVGGTAGSAIDGNIFTTDIGGVGSILGGQIN